MIFFTITKKHLKLLRRFEVGWQHCETGAPCISCKRPYGNSWVAGDMHEILTGKRPEALTDEQEAQYFKLHCETKTALQICLSTGSFKPGKYVSTKFLNDWRLCP